MALTLTVLLKLDGEKQINGNLLLQSSCCLSHRTSLCLEFKTFLSFRTEKIIVCLYIFYTFIKGKRMSEDVKHQWTSNLQIFRKHVKTNEELIRNQV